MLKVLHTGDWHIGSFPGPEVGGQNARFQDICRCLDFQAMYAEEHRPDLIVVSGDIFHQARVWSDRGLRESRTAIDHIRRLSNVAPTVVLRGTPNHDSEEQFEMLTTAFYGDDSVSVVTEPEVIHIHTYHGQRVDVACIPGFDRGVHRAAHPGLSREEETQVFTDELAKVVLGLKAQCEPGVTSILSTHFTVPGCNMESGQTALFAQFEPVIYPDTLKAADFDLVALGHIHRPQQLPEAGRAVFYCGSITGLNFNDEGQPRGFYIHDIDDDGEAWSEYIETPYREFETIRLNEDDVCTMLSAERVVVPDRLKGKIVRVLYTCSDETNKAFNKAVLEKRLYDGGVFYVSEITPEEITTSVNRDELHGDNSPEQNLAEYLAEKEKSPEDAQRIIELARPIISEAMEKGRLETPTGLFMPVEIEVKNYRNYRDELFSYDGISFATINGENGAGKSSLFMDAMLDALFEEPREGDLTGWICNDPDARSGSIKFTFYLGTKLYRVTRTRTKLGKAIKVTSGYRCVKHNADPKVGGSRTSRHLYGIAADWRTKDRSVNPVALGIIAAAQGFGAVGIYWHDKAATVHTDTRGGKATWLCVQPGVYPSTTYNKFVLPTIEQGCTGAANRAATVMLQRLLGITHDGSFGPATTKALMEAQHKRGLAADGICGPKSWTVLSGADKYL